MMTYLLQNARIEATSLSLGCRRLQRLDRELARHTVDGVLHVSRCPPQRAESEVREDIVKIHSYYNTICIPPVVMTCCWHQTKSLLPSFQVLEKNKNSYSIEILLLDCLTEIQKPLLHVFIDNKRREPLVV